MAAAWSCRMVELASGGFVFVLGGRPKGSLPPRGCHISQLCLASFSLADTTAPFEQDPWVWTSAEEREALAQEG